MNRTCFISKSCHGGTVIDTVTEGKTDIYGKTLEETREEYPDAEVMTLEDFCDWKAKQQRTPIKWLPSTHAAYEEMLGCLPPIDWNSGGFLVGEPYDHDAGNGLPRYTGYRRKNGKYQVSSRPMTRPEFREAA